MTSEREEIADQFEEHRTHLRDVAYRMLGSASDADDAVQEAWRRSTRTVVVGVQQIVPGGPTSARQVQRAIRIVRLKRSAVAGHQVKFVDLPEKAQ